jgi:hypothetical protein
MPKVFLQCFDINILIFRFPFSFGAISKGEYEDRSVTTTTNEGTDTSFLCHDSKDRDDQRKIFEIVRNIVIYL